MRGPEKVGPEIAAARTMGFVSYSFVANKFLLLLPGYIVYHHFIYYYAEAANSGQNHIQHNTAQSSRIKKGTIYTVINQIKI